MKPTLPVFVFILLFGVSSVFGQSDFYSKRWSEVYRYELKALPKSALNVVDTIYGKAKHEGNIEQLTKALLYQSKFAVLIEENSELRIVQKLKKELSESKTPQKNILESILANIYWQYFQENRWKYYHRSRTTEKVNTDDFRTWDADAMFQETHRHFQNSLQNAQQLQKINLSSINDILTVAENSRLYRPTIFDLLAHNALDFYRTAESLVIKPIHKFTFNDIRYFDDFENLVFAVPDSLAPHLQAAKIYQALLLFHKETKDTAAYVNLEIERLQLLAEEGSFDNVTELHKRSLTKLQSAYNKHSSSALIDFELASILFKEGSDYSPQKVKSQFKKREALEICDKTIVTFPGSDGAVKCKILRENILSAKLELIAEEYIPINTASRVLVKYVNTDKLLFFVSRVMEEFEKKFDVPISDSLKLAELAKMKLTARWEAQLKNLKDHQEHSTEIMVPALPQGKYVLWAKVADESDNATNFVFGYAFIQVTNLALLESAFEDSYRYQVVDRNTGKPVNEANVHFETRAYNNHTVQIDQHFTTDKSGFFEIRKQAKHFSFIQATINYQGDTAIVGEFYINQAPRHKYEDEDSYSAKTFLFSDRSIYRPGQTVYFKGILIKTQREKSKVVSGEYVEIFLADVNGEEVASLRLKTNSFGSFSGEFKLPASGLTGEYSLYADEDMDGDSKFYEDIEDFNPEYLTISVEEYKRPTFEASFKPIKETFKLNDTIIVNGTALAYSVAKIGGAKVSYHIKRTVRYPHYYYWHYRDNYSEGEEIAFGETVTSKEGEFSIDFEAIPDETVSENEKPVFNYEVTIDVTDINGETRSATTTVKVGYHTLLATMTVPPSVDRKNLEIKIGVNTENLNGQHVPSKGTVQVFKLQSPDSPVRKRPWPSPDLPLITKEEFRKLFPHDPYKEESDPLKWEKGKLVATVPFDTERSKELKLRLDRNWELGSYLMELSTADPEGNAITDMHRFQVVESGSKTVADHQLMIFETDKGSYKVGDLARLKIGSASSDITLTVSLERDHKIVKTYVEHLSGNTKEITIPITEAMTDGFALHCSAVNYNSFFFEKKIIPVVSDREQIEIETITFKDKLQPGAKETWSFEIKGGEALTKEVEVLASMYDASLDQFKAHQWTFNPVPVSNYYSYYYTSGNDSFSELHFTTGNQHKTYYSVPRQHYDQIDWFGFTLTNNYYIRQRYLERLYPSGTDPDKPSKVTMGNTKNKMDGYIYGTITTRDGEPLPGVNILIKSTTRGTVTDQQGNYMIEADRGEVLIFSFVGYSTAEAKVSRKNTIDVLMEEDVTALSEVVVTSLGIVMEKKSLSYAYSLAALDSDTTGSDVAMMPLRGKVAGVQITGIPGGDAKLVIRGNSSMSAEPLYVVDGVVVEASKIDQSDLASVQALKGDAATALYGARAANGVIMITTKSGQKKLDEELAKISSRKNFNETAFFFPHITTNETGKIRFTFTTPEALTRWKLQLLAHTKDLITTTKTLQTVTQKELMVTPNAPRFMRVNDEIVFSAKITNLSSRNKDGKVALQLFNAITGESTDQALQNVTRNQLFKIGAKASTEVSWKLKVPAGIDALQYKVVAKAGNFSDGEQNVLPVLSNRMLVTETMPMYVRAGQTKTFSLEKLKSTTSSTLQHHQLTLEITSNPAWYALQALPYLMEFPHECAEQMFSRYYANALASHVVNSNPKVKAVFDKWSSSNTLISNLEKNEELKSIIIQETPWLRDAQSESEQKKRIALLFDLNNMKGQLQSTLDKLQNMQLSDGSFPWFSGGYASRYITQHIASGFGHFKQLKVLDLKNTSDILNKAIGFLDEEMIRDYTGLLEQANKAKGQVKNHDEGDRLAKEYLEKRHVYETHLHYLYMRSFFPDIQLSERLTPAVEYYRNQSGKYWKDFTLYLKGMTALIHHRNQNSLISKEIIHSLKENSIVSDELGMYWKENKSGWYWYESPVETQSLLIEAFAEIEANNENLSGEEKRKTIDELRIWLLKNKQTSQWKTTKATTEAVYALLMNGTDWLPMEGQLEITVGNKKLTIDTKQAEAGTGYFKTSWKGDAISPAMNEVTMAKKDDGIVWGGLYWQYFEDLDKITVAETPLKLSKKVFVVSRTDKGELLTEVNTTMPLAVGDLLRIRIELQADRPMEFLHMKDMRASGLEPVDVLSEYKWQEGLGYYQSTKDAATHFFFDYMPQGVYVFEYDLRVNNNGNFSNGITTIQNMYAPEFSSHSEGIRIEVKK